MSDDDLMALLELAKEKDFEYPPELLEKDREYLISQIKAELAQLLWSNRDYYYITRSDSDPTIQRALELFGEARDVSSVWR